LTWEKVAKPTISPSAGVVKEEGQDQKNFHYIYILKKQVAAPEQAKAPAGENQPGEEKAPSEEDKKEDEDMNK
jgi:hypothetical protein